MIFNIDLRQSGSIALKDDNGLVLTYEELAKIIQGSHGMLSERSLVLILAHNDVPTASFLLSCLEKGWVPLLVNSNIDELLLNEYILKYRPNAIFSGDVEKYSRLLKCLQKKKWFDSSIFILNQEKHELNRNLSLLLPTSGSTGSPKLVRHSYDNLRISAESVSEFFKFTPSDVGLATLPIYYTMGLSVVYSLLSAGAQVRLSNYSITDREFWNVLKSEEVSVLTGVPYSFDLLFKMRFERIKIPSLRIISQGGGKLSDAVWEKLVIYAEQNNLQFIPTYGQTEGTARMSFLDSKYTNTKKGSIGKAIPNGSFEIWDALDRPIEEMVATGELIYKGGNVTLGYAEDLNDLKKGDERFGILRTGDIVRRDVDGFYYIIGRSKRFLKIFGLRISLDEIELLIKNHFQIDCYCSGSDELLEIYVNREDLLEEIKFWLVKKINLFHNVVQVNYIVEIPRNNIGKVIFKS